MTAQQLQKVRQLRTLNAPKETATSCEAAALQTNQEDGRRTRLHAIERLVLSQP